LALNSDILKQETLIAGIVAIVAMAGIFLGGGKLSMPNVSDIALWKI